MSQQALPCTPPHQNDRGWVHFFSYGCLVPPKFFPQKKVDFVGDIKSIKTCFCVFLLKCNFHQLPITLYTFKRTDQAGTFMSLKCVTYYANYRSWHQSSKIQVVS